MFYIQGDKMKISAYCTTRNAEEMEYPYLESIRSHLAFADEVVVFDSSNGKDKTLETLLALAEKEPKLKVVHSDKIPWDAPNHGIYDGYTKTLSRKQCTGDVLWQFDIDEVLHEKHVPLIRPLAETFMKQNAYDLLALPVIDYWGREGKARLDVTVWKWRLSKNYSYIIHGIPLQLRKYENGLLYAQHGTDGCDYINSDSGQIIPCAGYLPPGFEQMKQASVKDEKLVPKVEKFLNETYSQLPGVHHYSWFNIERKIRNFRTFWNASWKSLYNEDRDEKGNPFFPGLTWAEITDEMIKQKALELEQGTGGHVFHRPWDGSKNNSYRVEMGHPDIVKEWIEKNI
jgi:hypothetical protein